MNRFWVFLALFSLFAGPVLADGCGKRIRVGVSLPLTAGPVSSGVSVKNSMILASERHDPEQCVRFEFQDDQLLPKAALANVTKFIDVDKDDAVVVYGTPTSLAVVDLVEKRKVPMIAFSILGRVVEGKEFVVKHWCTAESLSAAVVGEVARRGYKRVAIVTTTNDAMIGLRDLYLRAAPTEIVFNEQFVKDEFDFSSVIPRLRAAKPDAVYVLLYPPQAAPFMKKLRELGYKQDAFGVHNIEDPSEVAAAGGAMIGMWLANGDETAGENYVESYRKRFGQAPSIGGANGYDVAKLIIEGARSGGDLNGYFHSVRNFSGAFGRYGATGRSDFDLPAVVKSVSSTGFSKVDLSSR